MQDHAEGAENLLLTAMRNFDPKVIAAAQASAILALSEEVRRVANALEEWVTSR